MVIALIQSIGPGALLTKTDIEHAYKIIPIHPEDIPALGIRWFKDWLWDYTLPMSSRSGVVYWRLSQTPSNSWQKLKFVGRWAMCWMTFSWFPPINPNQMWDYCVSYLYVNFWESPLSARKWSQVPVLSSSASLWIKMEARLPQDKLAKYLRLVNTY